MSETANIAAMAELLSGKVFGVFGWSQVGPINFNFKDDTSKDIKRHTKHPCDVIFRYDDPYRRQPIYLITDLKSYAKASVESKEKLQGNITGLASALRCARKSNEFKKHLPEDSGAINGLIFVFNNDNEFDGDFGVLLKSKGPSLIDIPYDSKIYIFGPPQIQFLCDIVNDLEKIFGEDVPLAGQFKFFHPNLISSIPDRNRWPSAMPEMLTSPYIISIYTKETSVKEGDLTKILSRDYTNFYYKGSGATYEEFCFIFDYCFRYNLIDDNHSIKIKMPYCCEDAASNFDKAKQEFSRHFYKQDKGFDKLAKIELIQIPTAIFEFHDKIIGMDKRKEFANAK